MLFRALRCMAMPAIALFLLGEQGPFAFADRPTIELAPAALTLDPRMLQGLSPGQQERQIQRIAKAWVRENAGRVPVIYPGKIEALPPPDDAALDGLNAMGPESLGRLVVKTIDFVRDFSGNSDSAIHSDFYAEYMHALSKRAPGFAWVVVAERTSFDVTTMNGLREGGALGIQIPLLGKKTLFLEDGQGQVVLRIMPIGGNYETVNINANAMYSTSSPDSGIVIRPSAELDASYLLHGVRPGLRFLVQPRITDPTQARMLAEVYVDIGISVNKPMVQKISIVPRCMIDFSNDHNSLSGPDAPTFQMGYRLLNNVSTCSISGEFAWGL